MKKTTAILAIVLAAVCANAEKKVVAFGSIPQAAQQFANANFKGKQLASTQVDTMLFGAITEGYNIVYTDGTEIEFDADGNWKEIKAKTSAVPADLVPEKIKQYVKENFKGLPIVKIEQDAKGYEIELSNGRGLKFDPNFIFIGLD